MHAGAYRELLFTRDMTVQIRVETETDNDAVRAINFAAFGQSLEGGIVDALRGSKDTVSLVAEQKGCIIGHILFTTVTVGSPSGQSTGLALGPMAVAPEFQNKGVGSALVRDGLERLRKAQCPYVIVLGHPNFYPRFGFVPASRFGVKSQWEGVPDEAFMITVFDRSALSSDGGVAYYRREFDVAM